MTRSGPRITLVALAVLAVAFGGALFPASGFGSVPADETDLIGADRAAEPAAGSGSDTRGSGPTGTDGVETAAADEPTPVSTVAERDAATASPTPEPTATATPTAVPDSDDDTSSGGGAIGLVSWLLGAGLLALAGVSVLAGLSSRLGDGGSGDGPALGPFSFGWAFGGDGVSPAGLVKRVPQATMVALVGASTGTARVLSTAGSVAGDAAAGLATAFEGGSRATGSLLAGLGGLFSSSGGSLLSIRGVLSGLASGGSGGASGRAPDADARTAAPVEPESSDDPIRTVEGAWEAFADPLPVRDREARTPGELARTAVDRGDPADRVERLRDVFRDVRYGGAPASEDRTRTAVEAARAVLDRREDEE
ncbi:hypothetical protein C475_10074 [Halosimplex carlsbadense 2-9-1]|uniref:Protein-glutamine gamma-glutamyltransferase-like C-terminal domain-containing protein n=1 Tax=Halosimplex carlsbadense 2-9-1 TaxID=797114 RepID=M0CT06_9EURY|nr:DUF4129 domain-containing protein [Halosimplex carlsbadense]ELZ25798.1 hypothetical protein C475_10074 [Halosimplex carlsbadense 2-9-1]